MLVIVGESGAGKSTIEDYMVRVGGMKKAVSVTSREAREGEVDGVDYHFRSRAEVESMRDAGELAEYAEYKGNLYGVMRSECKDDRVVVVEREGLRQLKEDPDLDVHAVYLYLEESIRQSRMESRGDSKEYAAERIAYDRETFRGIGNLVDKTFNTKSMSIEGVGEAVRKWYEGRERREKSIDKE